MFYSIGFRLSKKLYISGTSRTPNGSTLGVRRPLQTAILRV